MNLKLSNADRWAIGAIYAIPILVLGAALIMAFEHAQDWAARHSNAGAPPWEGWAFAIMIELPALLGLLLIRVLPKITGGMKSRGAKVVPRLLFLGAAAISLAIQQAYAGSDASASERIVAGLPSVFAGIFVEILFWVVGLIDEARQSMAAEDMAEAERTRPRVGLGDIPAAPVLSPRHAQPVSVPDTRTSEAMSPDIALGHRTRTSDPQRPHVTPGPGGHDTATQPRGEGDTAQLTDDVTPHVLPGPDIYVPPARHPDMEADMSPGAEQDTDTDVTPDTGGDVRPDVLSDDGDTDAGVTPDMQPDMTDPRWPEAAVMRRRGDTVKTIAEHFGVTTRTVTRWKLPAPDATRPVNGYAHPEMTGADH